MSKKWLVISFSGGRSSAYMTWRILNDKYYTDRYNIIVIFANTGQEHDLTLDFIHNCDKYFNFGTIWVEAEVHHIKRKGTTHRIVTYETASRNGEPFKQVISKYGIPNKKFPHCTRELKLAPIQSVMKLMGLNFKNCTTAIGIRADETRRVSKTADIKNIIYPLVDWGVVKDDVIDWWSQQPFDLQIKEHQGNCKWCWKKSDKKLFTNIRDNPEWFEFPMLMEANFPNVGADCDGEVARTFFRGGRSTIQLIQQYHLSKDNLLPINENDSGNCSESCELFTLDNVANNNDT